MVTHPKTRESSTRLVSHYDDEAPMHHLNSQVSEKHTLLVGQHVPPAHWSALLCRGQSAICVVVALVAGYSLVTQNGAHQQLFVVPEGHKLQDATQSTPHGSIHALPHGKWVPVRPVVGPAAPEHGGVALPFSIGSMTIVAPESGFAGWLWRSFRTPFLIWLALTAVRFVINVVTLVIQILQAKKEKDTMSFSAGPDAMQAQPGLLDTAQSNPLLNLLPQGQRPTGKVSTTRPGALPVNPGLHTGVLRNGLRYYILPNRSPPGKFEAHLEILSGSAHELESQQGMAHLLEHVAWMGSTKRQVMSGTGSKANAYTDFHHTVFHASCPTYLQRDHRKPKSMLPVAFDALVDVMTTKVTHGRLEKERAVVLSEASMVNTMEYRIEIQILSELHRENRISRRFPIGQIPMIKSWTMEEVQRYHDMHYRPDNAVLYVVGDVDPKEVEQTVREKFGGLKSRLDTEKLLRESGEYPPVSMRNMTHYWPPLVHRWSTTPEETRALIPETLVAAEDPYVLRLNGDAMPGVDEVVPTPATFQHELIQSFSFHLFAKRPIEPVVDEHSLKREIMRKLAIASLQIRFNVVQRADPLFLSVEFNQSNWPREACAVCSLDLSADVSRWRDAVATAVREIRRLGIHGISASELARYKTAILTESEMLAAQADQLDTQDVMKWLMEAAACGHTFIHPHDSLAVTRKVVSTITLEEVNEVARELCEHLSHPVPAQGVRPAAIIACAPQIDRTGQEFILSADEVKSIIQGVIDSEVEPMHDIEVPETLFTDEEIQEAAAAVPPDFVEFVPKSPPGIPPQPPTLGVYDPSTGVMQRRLQNGVAINMKSMTTEPQRGSIRLLVPGGRRMETPDLAGVMTLGARTMQECGGFGRFARESVELFCIDHLLTVEILTHQDWFTVDFIFPTTPGGATGQVTGLEAAMQVVRVILCHLEWEEDGFERAKQALHQSYQSTMKNLDLACQEKIISTLTNYDPQYRHPTHAQIDAATLDVVKEQVGELFADTSRVEISISADAAIEELEDLALKYIGTIAPRQSTRPIPQNAVPVNDQYRIRAKKGNLLRLTLNDSDERAMGYLAGYAPNHWGIDAEGVYIGDRLNALAMARAGGRPVPAAVAARRSHPLFGRAALAILREVVVRRLFTVVREERQLTYDASFTFLGFDAVKGGLYMVSVTTSPQQAEEAVQACQDALHSLTEPFGIMAESVLAAKRNLQSTHETDINTNRYWVEVLGGTQLDPNPAKTVAAVGEYRRMLNEVTTDDLQLLVEYLGFSQGSNLALVGISSPQVAEEGLIDVEVEPALA